MALEIDISRRRFTLDEYHRMGKVGILHEDDRVELIQGEIVQMPPSDPFTPPGSPRSPSASPGTWEIARSSGRRIPW
jgi:hypothetical protein